MVISPHTQNQSQGDYSRGFTLIEMLLVVAIIVVVTSVVLANNNRFGGTVQLQNLAFDIALSTREAQIYGVSVLHFKSGANSSFTAPFGVHFDITNNNNTMYLIFADAVTEDGHYTTGELLTSTNIGRGFFIGDLCVTPSSGTEDCSISKLDVVYKHPEPDAYIRVDDQPEVNVRARIVVMSPRGDEMSIHVESNGQISVHN